MSKKSSQNLDPLVTVRETAEFLGVSEKTVRREIDARNLSVVRVGPTGRGIRIRHSEIHRYIAGRTE